MFTFENETLKLQFGNERYFYGIFKIIFILLSVAFFQRFNKELHVTSVGRSHNPKSSHCDSDKLVCALDIRSRSLTPEEVTWLANQNTYLKPYVDIIIEDHRFTSEIPAGGDHIHIELNPGYWVKF